MKYCIDSSDEGIDRQPELYNYLTSDIENINRYSVDYELPTVLLKSLLSECKSPRLNVWEYQIASAPGNIHLSD
jgi:hypothetical protein